MRYQLEIQQLLLIHSLPSTSTSVLHYLEGTLLDWLAGLLHRLRYLIKKLSVPLPHTTSLTLASTSSAASSSSASSSSAATSASNVPYDLLILLLLQRQDRNLFYRTNLYLSWEETRKKAKESAYGVSELEMPATTVGQDGESSTANSGGLGDEGGPDPEDAWLKGDITPSSHQLGIEGISFGRLQNDVLSLFGEHARQAASPSTEESIELNKDLMALANVLANQEPGWPEHLERLRKADEMTKNMSLSQYIQFSEARQSTSFSHQKTRSKRFKEFIAPLLTAFEIPPSDELLDLLGFLAYEILSMHIEKAKTEAGARVSILRQDEAKVKSAKVAERRRRNAALKKTTAVKKKQVIARKGKITAKKSQVPRSPKSAGGRKLKVSTESAAGDSEMQADKAPSAPDDTSNKENAGNAAEAEAKAMTEAEPDGKAQDSAKAKEIFRSPPAPKQQQRTPSKSKAALDKEKESSRAAALEQERYEANLRPMGPFSSLPLSGGFGSADTSSTNPGSSTNARPSLPTSSSFAAGKLPCPGEVGFLGDRQADVSEKVQTPMVNSDIASAQDVLLGDFELCSWKEGRKIRAGGWGGRFRR